MNPRNLIKNSFDKSKVCNYMNVGTGKDISIKDLAKIIAKYTNFSGKIHWDKSKPDGTPRKLLDISNLLRLGWSPKIKLFDEIKKTIKDFELNFENNNLRC